MSDGIQTARHEGAEARSAGQPFQSNPYPLGSQASREWSKGYESREFAKPVYCVDCQTRICRRATRCRSCSGKRNSELPQVIAARQEYLSRPETLAKTRATLHRPEVYAKRGAAYRANKLRDVPEAYRDLYASLKRYGSAAERLAMVQEQMRKDGVAA